MKLPKPAKNILHFLSRIFTNLIVKLLCKSLKLNIKLPESTQQLFNSNKNYVVSFWHGTMLFPWYYFKNKNFAAIVSKSKDGELLSNLLKKWNYQLARGSSHNGGKEAFSNLIKAALNNKSIAITPDGPTGPIYEFKPGAVIIAKKTEIPLILVAAGYSNYTQLKSWDEFKIPKFFSKVNLYFSEPIYITKKNSFEETDALIKKCEIELNLLQNEANKFE